MMNDTIKDAKKLNSTTWVPPNDRELSIRAKLNAGWSSKTNIISNTKNMIVEHLNGSVASNQTQISDNEYYEIEKVIQRAAMIEQKEISRITRLYQRYNTMNKPQGNGETECLICNCNFGLLAANPRICNNCLKNVCSTCSIDALSTPKHATIWLCKICAEYRDFLKKSGAWFNKKIPFPIDQPSLLPLSLSAGTTPSANNTPVSSVNKTLSYLNKHTSVSSNTSISSSLTNEPIQLTPASTNSQHNLNLISSNNNNNNNYVNYNINNEINETSKLKKQPEIKKTNLNDSTEDSNIRNNLDDMTLLFNPSNSTTTNLKKQLNIKQANKSSDQSVGDISNDLDFENFTKEKLKQESNNSSKLVESGPSSFSISSTSSLPSQSSQLSNKQQLTNNKSNPSQSNNKINEPITSVKTIHEQISNSRNLKSNNVNQQLKEEKIETSQTINSISSLNSNKSTLSELGSLQFSIEYVQSLHQLKIHLISAKNLPACDSNGLSDPYVKIHLLPGIAKATKLRSKTIYKNLNPKFNETLQYDGINLHDLDEKTLRLTVLDEDKFGFDFIGEYRVPLKTIILNEINYFDVDLERKRELGDETDTKFRGKINFSLKYSKTSSCLYVKINKCRQLLPMDKGKSSDPFVEISLLPFSKENSNKQKFKTTIKWKTLDPEYLEEFKFSNIDLKTLLTKTIEISVYDKDFGKCDFIGTVKLGQQRTGDELKHFFTMIKNPELYHEQWHSLQLNEDNNLNYDESSSISSHNS